MTRTLIAMFAGALFSAGFASREYGTLFAFLAVFAIYFYHYYRG